jgi:hypothetical protein
MPRRHLDRYAEARLEAMLRQQEQEAREQAEQQAQQPQQRGMAMWNGLVEQRILDAMAKGMFDNLQGTGQPLNLDDDAFVPLELRMAFRMLRSTGLAPLWVQMNKEIRDDIARMEHFRSYVHGRWERISVIERDHLRQQYIDRINDINGKIINYNIMAPSSQVHMAILIMDEELIKFDHPPSG